MQAQIFNVTFISVCFSSIFFLPYTRMLISYFKSIYHIFKSYDVEILSYALVGRFQIQHSTLEQQWGIASLESLLILQELVLDGCFCWRKCLTQVYFSFYRKLPSLNVNNKYTWTWILHLDDELFITNSKIALKKGYWNTIALMCSKVYRVNYQNIDIIFFPKNKKFL